MTCTTGTIGCKPDTYETASLGASSANAAFKVRRLEKQDVSTWWIHKVSFTVKFCKPLSDLSPSMRDWRTFDRRIPNVSATSGLTVPISAYELEVELSFKNSYDAADMRKLAEAGMRNYLHQHQAEALEGSSSITSEQFKKVRTYEVTDGVVRV